MTQVIDQVICQWPRSLQGWHNFVDGYLVWCFLSVNYYSLFFSVFQGFTKFIQVGRVVYMASGPLQGKICAVVNIIDQNRVSCICMCLCGITSGARSANEFFCGLREKSEYARPDRTRPHHAFEKLISLERVDRFTSGLLCSMSPFNKFRIWPTPIPAGVCHGTRHVRRRGCRRHHTPGNSSTAGPIAFKFGVCLETS